MDNKYFKSALSGFTFDIAGGSAIRHLADKGYTVKRIKDKIGYPVPLEKIQKTVWEHLVAEKVLLMEEPGTKPSEDKIIYIEKPGKYGRKSFCGKVLTQKDYSGIVWKVTKYSQAKKAGFSSYIAEKCCQNGRDNAYVSCDFGIIKKEKPYNFEQMVSALYSRQREYIEGLKWQEKRVYHRLDLRMQEIICMLYEKGLYTGCCYFMELGEKIIF